MTLKVRITPMETTLGLRSKWTKSQTQVSCEQYFKGFTIRRVVTLCKVVQP